MIRAWLNAYHGRMASRYAALALANVYSFELWRGYTRAAKRHAVCIR